MSQEHIDFVNSEMERRARENDWQWNGPPRDESLRSALEFCDIIPDNIPAPNIFYVDSDGYIYLVWIKDETALDTLGIGMFPSSRRAYLDYKKKCWMADVKSTKILELYIAGRLKPVRSHWTLDGTDPMLGKVD